MSKAAGNETGSLGKNAVVDAGKWRTITREANSGYPLKGDVERMVRRRFQNLKPFREGNWWWLTPRIDEYNDGRIVHKKTRIKLAPADVGPREASKIAAERLHPMNQGQESIGSCTPLRVFVDSTYRQAVLPLLASTTRSNYEYVLESRLLPAFGNSALRALDTLMLQRYFSSLKCSHTVASKIRDVLASVLLSAVRFGLLMRNPLENVQLPPQRTAKRMKPTITPEQFHSLVGLMAEPYASMVYVCVLAGLRVSELIGLRWEDVHVDSLTIDERYCRGDWACPKTSGSAATIAVPASVIARIQQLKEADVTINWGAHGARKTFKLVRSDAPESLVFQSVRTGRPMNDGNVLRRHIKPTAGKLSLDFVNWQVLRRSYATWLVQAGADPKAVQGQMRHSRIQTTMDIYAQFVPESQRRAVKQMMDMVGQSQRNVALN